ncbi:septum formation family protein [Protaetiibacter mangrovi]|uniref:Septum formation family protein n=1 Tax=Protaetiibacter mangrovi TaxID=2970926 RepID=A0ABT1ZEZ7_9MICO|nr:septum formation family protein [Protaetiibacter mangrovi]MCS0499265.1 septum formation family protein [Protaetiibacter mangrovi]
MPRRLVAALAGVSLLAVLSGCAMPLPLPIPRGPGAAGTADGGPAAPAGAPVVGDCLDGMNGVDSDWGSHVECTRPHLYDVVAIDEWPGMDAAIDGATPARVFSAINGGSDDTFVSEYWGWAHEFCAAAVRDALGWGGLHPRYDDLHVMPAGEWGFDMSLAARSDFDAGEHRTLCSLGWFDEHARTTGATLPEDFVADAGAGTEECWVTDSTTADPVDCTEPHTDQTILWFDARSAFGDSFLAPETEFTDTQWQLVNATCADLVAPLLPTVPEGLTVWGWARYPEIWEDLADAPPVPDTWYTMDCLVGSYDGSEFVGDLLDGTRPVLIPGTAAGSQSA